MPKPPVKAEVNTFVGGLVTEASPLNYPPNASLDEVNFVLSQKGMRRRRMGLHNPDPNKYFEMVPGSDGFVDDRPEVFRWVDAGGIPGSNWMVVSSAGVVSILPDGGSGNLIPGVLDPAFSIELVTAGLGRYYHKFSSVDGNLIITTPNSSLVGVISSNRNRLAPAFTLSTKELLTRDFWGIESGTFYDDDDLFRAASITTPDLYNLYNQGWGVPRSKLDFTLADPVVYHNTVNSQYPANVDSVWAGMTTKINSSGDVPQEVFSPRLLKDTYGDTSGVSKGYFIINALARGLGRSTAWNSNRVRYPQLLANTAPHSTWEIPRVDRSPQGPTISCGYAGRVFYGGFDGENFDGDEKSPNLKSYIFFSQILKADKAFGKCYQEGDPTSRTTPDVVETDGGFIQIEGAGLIKNLVPAGNSLIVLADNGVWAVEGGSEYGFSATNYKVARISEVGIIGRHTAVFSEGKVFYWSRHSINVVARDQVGSWAVESISDSRIKTFFQKMKIVNHDFIYSVYDKYTSTIRWVFKEEGQSLAELQLNIQIPSFYFYRYRMDGPNDLDVANVIEVAPYEIIYPNGDVEMASTKIVAVLKTTDLTTSVDSYRIRALTLDNKDFVDFPSQGAVDAKAYLLTGSQIAGDSSVSKQIQYLTMHMGRSSKGVDGDGNIINDSACLMRMQWDWANSPVSNKWSSTRQVYRDLRAPSPFPMSPFESGFDVVTTKNMVRGQGRSFSMYLETEPGKDCIILGWSVAADGNGRT